MRKNSYFLMLILFSIACIKTIAQPNLQWIKNYGGLNGDSAYSIKQLTDGGYIVAGQSSSTNGDVSGNHGDVDYWVARLDGAGNIVWQKTFGGSGTDIGKSVVPTADGGFIVIGYSNSYDGDVTDHERNYIYGRTGDITYGYSPYEGWIIKVNGTGDLLWARSILYQANVWGDGAAIVDNPENFADKIIATSDGNFLIPVYRQNMPYDVNLYAPYLPYLLKINTNGNTVWETFILPSAYHSSIPTAVVETADGYTVVTVGEDGTGFFYGGYDTYLLKVSTAGAVIRTDIGDAYIKNYGGSGNDSAYSIRATADGGLIIAGKTNSTDYDLATAGNHGGYDSWLLKLNSTGDVEWSKTYGGSGEETARAIQETTDGYIMGGESFSSDGDVTGHHPSAAGEADNSDAWIIKTNTSGILQWAKSYGGDKNDAVYDIAKTSDGGFTAAGFTWYSFDDVVNKGSADWLVIKLAECGSVLPPPCSSAQKFCSCINPVVSNLTASGTGIKWYNVSSGGSALAATTPLVTGTYYVTQTTGSCESARKAVMVTVIQTPGLPLAAAQQFSACNSPVVSNLTASGTGLKWYQSATGSYALPSSYPLRTGIYYVSQTAGNLCTSGRTAVSVTVVACCTPNPVAVIDWKNLKLPLNRSLVYPNPTRGMFNMLAPVGKTVKKVAVQLSDMSGRTLFQRESLPLNGMIQESFDVSSLTPGTYIVKYFADGKFNSTKIVVQK